MPLCWVIAAEVESEDDLSKDVQRLVRQTIGPIAALKDVLFVKKLPKTRSGKVARNTLTAMVKGQPYKVS